MDLVGDPIVEAPSEAPDELGSKKDHGPSRGPNIGGPEGTSGRIGPKKDHGPKRGPNIGGPERTSRRIGLKKNHFVWPLGRLAHQITQLKLKRDASPPCLRWYHLKENSPGHPPHLLEI